MNFTKLFLRGVALLPSLVQGVEGLFGAKNGAQKKAAVLEIVESAVNVPQAIASKTIADPAGFSAGLSTIVDGVVQCLNASIWATQPTSAAGDDSTGKA